MSFRLGCFSFPGCMFPSDTSNLSNGNKFLLDVCGGSLSLHASSRDFLH